MPIFSIQIHQDNLPKSPSAEDHHVAFFVGGFPGMVEELDWQNLPLLSLFFHACLKFAYETTMSSAPEILHSPPHSVLRRSRFDGVLLPQDFPAACNRPHFRAWVWSAPRGGGDQFPCPAAPCFRRPSVIDPTPDTSDPQTPPTPHYPAPFPRWRGEVSGGRTKLRIAASLFF